jgi:hypothetical protein
MPLAAMRGAGEEIHLNRRQNVGKIRPHGNISRSKAVFVFEAVFVFQPEA